MAVLFLFNRKISPYPVVPRARFLLVADRRRYVANDNREGNAPVLDIVRARMFRTARRQILLPIYEVGPDRNVHAAI